MGQGEMGEWYCRGRVGGFGGEERGYGVVLWFGQTRSKPGKWTGWVCLELGLVGLGLVTWVGCGVSYLD